MLSDSYFHAVAAIDWRAMLPPVIPTMVFRKQSGRYAMRFYGELVAVYDAFDDWKRAHPGRVHSSYAIMCDDDQVELFAELAAESVQADFFALVA